MSVVHWCGEVWLGFGVEGDFWRFCGFEFLCSE